MVSLQHHEYYPDCLVDRPRLSRHALIIIVYLLTSTILSTKVTEQAQFGFQQTIPNNFEKISKHVVIVCIVT